MASVDGDGDLSYYGGGIMGRYEFPVGPGGLYAEAALRAGQVDMDFSSGDILNAAGGDTEYDSSSAYYGAHAGLGYVWDINERASLDFSTKYIWTHMDSDSVTISGDDIHFKAMDSQRWRSGARFSFAVNEYVAPYLGAYYEHEFSGKARATANGDSIKSPRLSGDTGIGEIGLTFTPFANADGTSMPLFLDLGVQGYTGVREGVTGSLQLRFEF